jgi:isochorismate synthase
MQAQRLPQSQEHWAAAATLAPIDPWRVALPMPQTFLWSHHDQVAAGFGVAVEFEPGASKTWGWIDELPSVRVEGSLTPPGPWFGGLAFDRSAASRRTKSWDGFPAARFVLPRILVWRRGDVCAMWAFGRDVGEANRTLAQAQSQLTETVPDARERSVSLSSESDRAAWDVLVQRALGVMERGALQKVVAARCLEVTAARTLDASVCAELLRRGAGPAATFLMRSSTGAAFIGATPERLVGLEDRALRTQALASSARPSQSVALTHEAKEQREHSAVVQDIQRALTPLSTSLHVAEAPRLLELPYISHLKTPIEATLRPGVGLSQVLEAMYPTAAVGGTPRAEALGFIRQQEGWDRGWYAGAIGWVGPGKADLHVAIRSALVHENRARVFVGAGLVLGSDAEREWQETEDKARPMLRALGESGALP